MKTLLIEVEDDIMEAYQNFSPEIQKLFCSEVSFIIRKMEKNARFVKLKSLVDELKNEIPESEMNREILVELLRPID